MADKYYKIAKQVHETERTYLLSLGKEAPSWEEFGLDRQELRINTVFLILEGGLTSPKDAHAAWMNHKINEGWTYGPEADSLAKTHPFLKNYDDLPKEHRMKDYILFNITNTSKDIVQDDPIM